MATETAIFAGGCFWCMVHPFDQQPGIIKVVSGYTGGTSLIQPTNKFVPIQPGIQKRLRLRLIPQ